MKRSLASLALATALFAAPLLAQGLINQVRTLAWKEDVHSARELVERGRPPQPTAEWLAAASWLARGASFAEQWDIAQQYAQEAYDGSVALLKDRSVDDDRNLATALGASIEVLAHAYDAAGDNAAAVDFLRRQRQRYSGTSIETRIQKNLLLLSIEGKPMPELAVDAHLGPEPRTTKELNGNVVLFFFWAHWCGDCKQQKPILETLHRQYTGEGLVIVGPTRFWGYTARGEDAAPEQELDYLKNAYNERYPIPKWMSVPISKENFINFGVSTTPTLVLVGRDGIVQMYHPGEMSQQELEAQIRPLLAGASD